MKITEAEWKIMEVLWKQPMTIMQLTKALYEETKWKKNTVISFLNKMVEKRAVYYVQGGKARIYHPKAAKEECGVMETREILKNYFDGNRSLMISTLVTHEKLTESEIAELCRLLDIKEDGK